MAFGLQLWKASKAKGPIAKSPDARRRAPKEVLACGDQKPKKKLGFPEKSMNKQRTLY